MCMVTNELRVMDLLPATWAAISDIDIGKERMLRGLGLLSEHVWDMSRSRDIIGSLVTYDPSDYCIAPGTPPIIRRRPPGWPEDA
jgi:hypothetical protein